jgi:hypothetical protein
MQRKHLYKRDHGAQADILCCDDRQTVPDARTLAFACLRQAALQAAITQIAGTVGMQDKCFGAGSRVVEVGAPSKEARCRRMIVSASKYREEGRPTADGMEQ